MSHTTLRFPSGSKRNHSQFQNTNTVARLHGVLTAAVRGVGRQMEQSGHEA
jgi:hypothetical protein